LIRRPERITYIVDAVNFADDTGRLHVVSYDASLSRSPRQVSIGAQKSSAGIASPTVVEQSLKDRRFSFMQFTQGEERKKSKGQEEKKKKRGIFRNKYFFGVVSCDFRFFYYRVVETRWVGSFLMIYRNNAATVWLGCWLIYVCLETR
jgi:hypothetical protein